MKPAHISRENINSHQLTLGMLVTLHLWSDLIEMAKRAGLDDLIFRSDGTNDDSD